MAKKQKPAGKGPQAIKKPVLSTKDDYRKALIQLVRRQLDCARRGLIGTPAWERAYRTDLKKFSRYALMAAVEAPVVELYIPSEDEPREMYGWIVQEAVELPGDFFTKPRVREMHVFRADDLEAMNLMAANVLADWIEQVTHDPEAAARSGEFMPARWFKGVKINISTLRSWSNRKKIETHGKGRTKLYHVATAFIRANIHPADGMERCRKEWAKRHDAGKK
jgi:hypothetical protein